MFAKEPIPALLALENGRVFRGEAMGALGTAVGETVFNTAITGYQEIITDPSYCRQLVTLTMPHIGNIGVNSEDEEAPCIHAAGLIIRDLPPLFSNWRAASALSTYLKKHAIVALAGIDTRALTRFLRTHGAQRGCIVAGLDIDTDAAIANAKSFPGLVGADLAKVVSTHQSYTWRAGPWSLEAGHAAPTPPGHYRVVAYDFGIKHNILRLLTEQGCEVTVVPAETSADDVLAMNPDGIFLSNGPGDPEPCHYAIASTQTFLEKQIPLFGICLGHQILALACGAKSVKMKFGHHGANHPVQVLDTGAVLITSQNHGFAVDEKSLPNRLRATHRSLFDGSLQGVEVVNRPAFGFQGHPEASPGPHDARPLFQQFSAQMADYQSRLSKN